MDLTGKVRQFFKTYAMLPNRSRILAAVSGGPDSVAMLYALYELREELKLHLEVAHLEHGIRGQEAKDDARFVAELSARLGLACHLKDVDLPRTKLEAGKGNLEAMGRSERYRFFAETAHRRKLAAVATAHTVNDQAETLVMRLFRGAGRKGLGGMEPLRRLDQSADDNLLLIRPFLHVTREEVMEFLAQRQIACRVDSSNADLFYLRNWIRLKLMPQLTGKFGADLPARLSSQAGVLRDEERYLDGLTREQFGKMTDGNDVKRLAFLAADRAVQRRILRLWLEQRRGHLRSLDFQHIEAALSLIAGGPPQGRLALPGGWELAREYDTLRLERRSRRVKRRCYSYDFQSGVTLNVVEAGMTIESKVSHHVPQKMPHDLMEAVFDADLLKGNLYVRNFRNGDRFHPIGMNGHKKVKDLFIENKLPLPSRAVLPMLAMGDEILWIPGQGRSELAKIGPATKVAVRLKASKSN